MVRTGLEAIWLLFTRAVARQVTGHNVTNKGFHALRRLC